MILFLQAEDDTDDTEGSGDAPSIGDDDGENESVQDLDASMEDMDDDGAGNLDEESMEEQVEGDTEEYEEEPSEL